jgi:hypothetical protein
VATEIKVYASDFAILKYAQQSVNDHTSNPAALGYNDILYLMFDPPVNGNQFKQVYRANAYPILAPAVLAYVQGPLPEDESITGTYQVFRARLLRNKFDAKTITYKTRQTDEVDLGGIEIRDSEIPRWIGCSGPNIMKATKTGIALNRIRFNLQYEIATLGANRPYLRIFIDETTTCGLAINEVSPSLGSIVKAEANIFTWDVTDEGLCLAALEQASAVFRWRSGASGTIHTINVSGNTQSITVPANTFAGTTSIQWQIAVTANSGVTTTSDWVTLSTADATPTAAPLSPVDTVIDGSKDVLFQWQHSISTGTAQSKADLQKSTDGQTWTTLATVTGAARQWTCPAGTLTSSIKYWRVRTYNADGVAGAWSDAAQIVVIAAPTAPSIQIKSTGPRPSISWQTSEQEAYQVELDGKLSGGTHYGTEKTWTSPAYLADGSHTVRVRVQNQYGMWSDWGAASLPVTNTPGAAISLNVEASSVAELSWQTTGSYDFYLVYRDGKPIAKLAQTQYTDELSSGSVSYQVRGCYDDSGNYGLSQAVGVRVLADVHMVSDLNTGETLRLPYSDSQHRQTTRTLSRQVELLQLSGAYYPVAVEVDSGTDALSITAALLDESEIRQLMGLVGKLVCAKTPQGDMVIGYITSLPKQHDGFLNVFNFTVEQIDFDDEVRL